MPPCTLMHKKVTDHDIKGSSWLYWNVFVVYLLFKTYYQPIYLTSHCTCLCRSVTLMLLGLRYDMFLFISVCCFHDCSVNWCHSEKWKRRICRGRLHAPSSRVEGRGHWKQWNHVQHVQWWEEDVHRGAATRRSQVQYVVSPQQMHAVNNNNNIKVRGIVFSWSLLWRLLLDKKVDNNFCNSNFILNPGWSTLTSSSR